MFAVWKFDLANVGENIVLMPYGSTILTVQTQYGSNCMWAKVDTTAECEERRINVVGTGHELEDDPGRYIGTVQSLGGALVWHVFDGGVR